MKLQAFATIGALALISCYAGPIDSDLSLEEHLMSDPHTPSAERFEKQALKAGHRHPWLFDMESGRVVTVRVEQQGIDVALRLLDPGGGSLMVMNSPNGEWGLEEITWVSNVAGSYRLEVVSESKEVLPGDYSFWSSSPKIASPQDEQHAQAIASLCEGDAIRRRADLKTLGDALTPYRASLTAWQELNNAEWQIRAWFRIGLTSERLAHGAAAEQAYTAARDLARKIGSLEDEVLNENHLARLDLHAGRLADAKVHIDHALAATSGPEHELLAANVMINLANWWHRSGDIDEAIRIFLELSRLWEEKRRPLHEAEVLQSLAILLERQGKIDDAVAMFQRCIEARAAGLDETGRVRSLLSLGNVYKRAGRSLDAIDILEQARDAGVEGHLGKRMAAFLHIDLGLAYSRRDDLEDNERYSRAFAELETAARLANEAGRRGILAFIDFNSGSLQLRQGKPQHAFESFKKAHSFFEQKKDARRLAAALLGMGQALRDQGRLLESLSYVEAAVSLVESLRLDHGTSESRMWFLASKWMYFEELIDILVELHSQGKQPSGAGSYAEQALEVVERKRARTFLDSLGEASLRNAVDPALLEKERRITEELAELEGIADEPGLDLDHKRSTLLLELETVRGQIQRSHPQYSEITRPDPLSIEEIRERVLDEGSTLLVYSLGQNQSYLWSIRRHGEIGLHVLGSREVLLDSASVALRALRTVSKAQQPQRLRALENLGDRLLNKTLADGVAVDPKGKARAPRLVIVPDGFLELIPFAALRIADPADPADTTYVLEQYEVISIPSAGSLDAIRRELASRPRSVYELMVLGDPVFSSEDPRASELTPSASAVGSKGGSSDGLRQAAHRAGFEDELPRLKLTGVEAETIYEPWAPFRRSSKFTGFDARRGLEFQNRLEGSRYLHLATHGVANRVRPEMSALAFSQIDRHGRPLQKGFLYAHELFSMRLSAELVVLSACETGVGPEVPGEGILGLSRAFMYAGAPRVITSLWNVGDGSTALLMTDFYRKMMAERRSPSSALRLAQLKMLQDPDWEIPAHWAAFIFVGNWLPSPDQPTGSDGPIDRAETGGAHIDPELLDQDYPTKSDDPTGQGFGTGSGIEFEAGGGLESESPSPPRSAVRLDLSDFDPDTYVNGIDAGTGRLLEAEPIAHKELSDGPLLSPRQSRNLQWWVQHHAIEDPFRLPVYGVDPDKLDQAGWMVLYGPDVTPDIEDALAPLVNQRKRQAKTRYHEPIYLKDQQTSMKFRRDQEIGFGPADPENIPYYLLIVGDPAKIPFELQYGLDVQYAVGRLHFDDTDDYERYAKTVKSLENKDFKPREAAIFGVDGTSRNDRFMIEALVDPLTQRLGLWKDEDPEHRPAIIRSPRDRKSDFIKLLQTPPGLLFAAGHGLSWDPYNRHFMSQNGALVCSDPRKEGRVVRETYFAGNDLDALAKTVKSDGGAFDLQGLITFMFSCYGAGTPEFDDFKEGSEWGQTIAPKPMISHLAKRMLAHGSQAFIGHIDRAWSTSFDWTSRKGDQVKIFDSICRQLLDGARVGHAMEWVNQKYAEGAAELGKISENRSFSAEQGNEIARIRKATLDARNYVVVGDPAVRLPGLKELRKKS